MKPAIALLLACATTLLAGEDDPLRVQARAQIRAADKDGQKAPDFGKRHEWLNLSRPVSLHEEFQGRVVLIDFWTYCCINCLHVLPDLDFLEKKYGKKPFAVIGCHSAKFSNEKERDNIRQAVVRHRVEHPVVVDEDLSIWNRFNVRSWPTMLLLGPEAQVLGLVSGEGNLDILDVYIDEALKYYGAKGALNPRPLPVRLERNTRKPGDLAFPGKVLYRDGILYVADTNHNRVLAFKTEPKTRKAAFFWAVGSGEIGLQDGRGERARFFHPQGMTLHGDVLWVADTENHAIRRVHLKTRAVTTVAGTGKQGHERAGIYPAKTFELNSPWDLLVHDGYLYVAMAGSHQIWRMSLARKRMESWVGNGRETRLDGKGTAAELAQPSGLTSDGEWLYFADSESSSIRRARFLDARVETVVGGDPNPRNLFAFGDKDGTGFHGKLQHPLGVFFHDGKIYVADTYNHEVRIVDPKLKSVTGFAGGPTVFDEPASVAVADGLLYVVDTNHHRIHAVDLATKKIDPVLLTGVPPVKVKSVEIPGTEIRDLGTVTLKPGATIELTTTIPPGWKYQAAPGAELKLGDHRASITGPKTSIPATEGNVEIEVLYYPCGDDGICRIRAVRYRAVLRFADDGKAILELRDSAGP